MQLRRLRCRHRWRSGAPARVRVVVGVVARTAWLCAQSCGTAASRAAGRDQTAALQCVHCRHRTRTRWRASMAPSAGPPHACSPRQSNHQTRHQSEQPAPCQTPQAKRAAAPVSSRRAVAACSRAAACARAPGCWQRLQDADAAPSAIAGATQRQASGLPGGAGARQRPAGPPVGVRRWPQSQQHLQGRLQQQRQPMPPPPPLRRPPARRGA